MRTFILATVVAIVCPLSARAADQTVLGHHFVVKGSSTAGTRRIVLIAEEPNADDAIVGDPTNSGATLAISVYGGTASAQTFMLVPELWRGNVANGYTYHDGTGANGPVKSVKLRKRPDGTLFLRAVINGAAGSIAIAPPNAGIGACTMLAIAGGDSYSTRFGDGTAVNRGAKLFKMKDPASEGTCIPCGNGFVDAGEQCDPGGVACAAAGACQSDCTCVYTAPSQPVLFFDEAAAAAANGNYPAADPLTVCGANDRRFLAELISNPVAYKVPLRLADIKASPSEIMVSGVATSVSLGAGDFPFDHTFGSDFNMDVALDPTYAAAAQTAGIVGGDLHVELSEGQFPHAERPAGLPTGEEWEQMSSDARTGIHTSFIPDAGARVLVMGHWIVDCGHTDFETELHPITFMANARIAGTKTVVDAFYNPYRETQQYHFDPALALAFDDPTRFDLAAPFPRMLILSVLRLQDLGLAPYQSIDHLESWAMLEPNRISPVAWRVCAPPGSSGTRLDVRQHWITRPGVQIDVTPDVTTGCAEVQVSVSGATVAAPTPRACVTPWDWLNQVAAAEAGVPNLDLQAQIGAYVPPQFQGRLDPDPILNCYDPLGGPPPETPPSGQTVEVRSDLLLPFYGTISVELVTD